MSSARPYKGLPSTVQLHLKRLTAYDRDMAAAGDDAEARDHVAQRYEMHDMPDHEDLSTCTVSARHLASKAGGKVFGYEHALNPTAKLGEAEGGHDFLVHGHHLIDWWAHHVAGEPRGYYDLKNPQDLHQIKTLYGDPAKWTEVDSKAEHPVVKGETKYPEATHNFMSELWDATDPHPFERLARIHRNESVVTCSPRYDGWHPVPTVGLDWLKAVAPRKGAGTRAMQTVTSLADKHGVRLELAVGSGPGGVKTSPKKMLRSFYRKHGFVAAPRQGADVMHRLPLSTHLNLDKAEETVPQLPPAPGTTPLKPGHVRLYHQTRAENLDSIRRDGLSLSAAKGFEGPRAIYASREPFYGSAETIPTVEFQVPEKEFQAPFVVGSRRERVAPSDFLAVHEPWHGHARYAENDPEVLKNVLAGQHDDLLTDHTYGPGIKYLKQKYNKPVVKAEDLAKAGDTIAALLTHPDPVERALALTLRHATPKHVAQAEQDPHPYVQAAVQRWKAKNTPPEQVNGYNVSHAQKNGTKYFFVHATPAHEQALGMYAPELSRHAAVQHRHLGHFLPNILGYVRYTGVPEGQMVVHETHAPWHTSPGARGAHVAHWLNQNLGTHHDPKRVEGTGQALLSDLAHHGILTRVFGGKDPEQVVHDAFVDWSRAKGAQHVGYRPLKKDQGYVTFPKLGVERVPTEPLVSRNPQQVNRWIRQNTKMRGVEAQDVTNDWMKTGGGAHTAPASSLWTATPPEQRAQTAIAVPGEKYSTNAVTRHEAQHSVFGLLGQRFGHHARRLAAERLVSVLNPEEKFSLDDMMAPSGYNWYQHPEEAVTCHQQYLNDPKWRAHVHKTLGMNDMASRHMHNTMKGTWKKMRAAAKTLTHEQIIGGLGPG